MKYYGKFDSNYDLITVAKGTEISNTQADAKITAALGTSGAIKTELDKKQNAPTVLTGTLTVGETSLTLSNSAITTSSIIDVYTDTYGIAPKTVVASAGSVTLTFKAQSTDLGVRVEVR